MEGRGTKKCEERHSLELSGADTAAAAKVASEVLVPGTAWTGSRPGRWSSDINNRFVSAGLEAVAVGSVGAEAPVTAVVVAGGPEVWVAGAWEGLVGGDAIGLTVCAEKRLAVICSENCRRQLSDANCPLKLHFFFTMHS